MWAGMEEGVSLVLPVHNEADNIEAVIRGFYNEIGGKMPLQIIVAEDGSTDGTREILTKLSQEIPMTILTEKTRQGYMDGLRRGLERRPVNTSYSAIRIDNTCHKISGEYTMIWMTAIWLMDGELGVPTQLSEGLCLKSSNRSQKKSLA
jgi:glycosyltransferase involved in cell wall biosynthesis